MSPFACAQGSPLRSLLLLGTILFLSLLSTSCDDDSSTPAAVEDTTPPAAVTDLAAEMDSTAVLLTWTATGDDGDTGTATRYDVRLAHADSVEWSEMTRIEDESAPKEAGEPESLRVVELTSETSHFFLLRAADEAANWSEVSNTATILVPDVMPPRAVDTLAVTEVTPTTVTLQWPAPGDDGGEGVAALYDLRYIVGPEFSEEEWETAHQVEGEPDPQSAGETEVITVTDLEEDTDYSFALKASDDEGNWSDISGVTRITTLETIPPNTVDDLVVTEVTTSSATLQWTAPGDDGDEGTAALYDIRYMAGPEFNPEDWDEAFQVDGEPEPRSAGETEIFTVTGLNEGEEYAFALTAVDDVPNVSGISNRTGGRTRSIPPAAVTDLEVIRTISTMATLQWTAPGDDEDVGTASMYDIRFVMGPEFLDEDWETAQQVDDEPVPQGAGAIEEFTAAGFQDGVEYSLALKTVDEADNWSEISGRYTFVLQDSTPPETVIDLEVIETTATTATLRWTAPSVDEDEASAQQYDIRYEETDRPTTLDWDLAQQVQGEPEPESPDASQEFRVTGLEERTGYSFALKAVDDNSNWSGVSNSDFYRTVTPEDDHWWDGFAPYPDGEGVDGWIHCMVVHDGALIVGGRFGTPGGVQAANIARWDETSWTSMGDGLGSGVFALGIYDGDLVAGGEFGVTLWNGSAWESLGSGVNGTVMDLAVFREDLFIGGDFTRAGGVPVENLARWDGEEWTAVRNVPFDEITALTTFGSHLYVGGGQHDDSDDDDIVRFVSRWNQQWRDVYTLPYLVCLEPWSGTRDMRVIGDKLVAAIRHCDQHFIHRYDGLDWGDRFGIPGPAENHMGVMVVCEYGGDVVVGGHMTFGSDGEAIAREGPGGWETLGVGVSYRHWDPMEAATVEAIEVYNGRLYIGGSFDLAGGKRSQNIARWDGR
jgi:hypothetical protein